MRVDSYSHGYCEAKFNVRPLWDYKAGFSKSIVGSILGEVVGYQTS